MGIPSEDGMPQLYTKHNPEYKAVNDPLMVIILTYLSDIRHIGMVFDWFEEEQNSVKQLYATEGSHSHVQEHTEQDRERNVP